MLPRALLPLVALLVIWPVSSAQAQVLDQAGAALEKAPLYVHPDVESALPRSEQRELRERIERSTAGPMWIAVLPAVALEEGGGGTIESAMVQLAGDVDRLGIYAVAVPGEGFKAATNGAIGHSAVRTAAASAVEANPGGGTAAILGDFLDDVDARADQVASEAPAGSVGQPQDGDGTGGFGVGAVILLGIGALVTGIVLFTGRERRRLQDRSIQEAKDSARDDLIALGEDIRALDADLELPGVPGAATDDHARALAAYERAEGAWKRARTPAELEPVSMALEEGRWALASAKARLEGDEPPVRRPPCFFDPRHGPSSRDVEWSPPYGAARMVPACESDARLVERGEDPQAKEVVVGGQRVPYWNAGPAYGPFAGGFFGGSGARLLPSILVGSVLGMSLGAAVGADDSVASGDDFDTGDFGGGDLGSGDFGGDFGGGHS